jgi:hypothetical protein
MLKFFDVLFDVLTSALALRVEVFLEFHGAIDLTDAVKKAALKVPPLLGVCLRPGVKLTPSPTPDEVKRMNEEGKRIDIKELGRDYCYWFVEKSQRQQRQQFWGYGALKMMLLKSDPATVAPPMRPPAKLRAQPFFKNLNLEALIAGGFALSDGFLQRSKEIFGETLKDEIVYPGLPFVFPQLQAEDFLQASEADIQSWFELFDVYVNECVPDRGVLIASKFDLESDIVQIVNQMRVQGLAYPGTERPGTLRRV